MTKEQVVQFRDVIAKDKILQVVCDNQHIFYDRVAQKCPIMWDDDNEVFTVCRVNQDPNMQKAFPIETVQTSYEHIQFMHCYDTTATALNLTCLDKLSEEQKQYFEEFLSLSTSQALTAPKRFENQINYSK